MMEPSTEQAERFHDFACAFEDTFPLSENQPTIIINQKRVWNFVHDWRYFIVEVFHFFVPHFKERNDCNYDTLYGMLYALYIESCMRIGRRYMRFSVKASILQERVQLKECDYAKSMNE